MNEINVNTLIEWNIPTQEEIRVERVLQIHNGEATLFDVDAKRGLPYQKPLSEIHDALESEEAKILPNDPWTPPPTEIRPKLLEKRDRTWKIIQSIVETPNYLTDFHARGKAIKSVMGSVSKKHVYSLLRKYWRGGQTINALIPLYSHCGAPNILRAGKTQKTGPKSKYPDNAGKMLTKEDVAHIDDGITLFYETQEKKSVKHAYRLTLAKFFNDGFEIKNCVREALIRPPHEIPSRTQFANRIKTTRNPATLLRKREGEHRFTLKHRSVLKQHQVYGPGAHYAIDFTKADIYVLNEIDKNQPVGRPTIYLIVDYFSHLVVGITVTIEDGSYANAALAIENAAADKVAFCRKYGFEITREDWPAEHLPTALLADRGELRGPIATPLPALGIRLDNTPPYRPDLKGLVERTFGLLNTELLHKLPARVRKDQSRGDKNPAQFAVLTLRELTTLVIRWVLMRNKETLNSYKADKDTVDVTPTPVALWNWGLENRSGSLRTFPTEHIKAAVLPMAQASITRRGLRLKGCYYTCSKAENEQWFVLANGKQSRIQVHYDPRNASHIYLGNDNGFEECHLINQTDIARDKSWVELESFNAKQMAKKSEATANVVQLQASLDAAIAAVTPKRPKKKNVKNIREARQAEILRMRTAEQKSAAPNVIPITSGEEDEVEAAQLKLLQSISA